MPTGFPATTGDIFTAADYNGLVTFEIKADQTADYTLTVADSYQVLVPMNKATAIALKIPTNAQRLSLSALSLLSSTKALGFAQFQRLLLALLQCCHLARSLLLRPLHNISQQLALRVAQILGILLVQSPNVK